MSKNPSDFNKIADDDKLFREMSAKLYVDTAVRFLAITNIRDEGG